MSLTLGDLDYYERSFPRPRGDEPDIPGVKEFQERFSPPARG